MKLKIQLELSGNELLDLLRKVPKSVAEKLAANTSVVSGENDAAFREFYSSMTELIASKKR